MEGTTTETLGARLRPTNFAYGTYFWSVSALQNGRGIGKSGTAAFVIEE